MPGVAADGRLHAGALHLGLAAHDSAPPRLALLSSPIALALRTLRGGLLGWLAGIGVFALIMGVISDSVSSGLSKSVQDLLEKLGTAANSPAGYLGFSFQYFILALSVFACFQLAAMRDDESEQRLETLFALPVRRRRWFAGRLGLVVAMTAALALAAGLLAWAGAASQGADVPFGRMVEAAANWTLGDDTLFASSLGFMVWVVVTATYLLRR